MAVKILAIPTEKGFTPMYESDWEKAKKYQKGEPIWITISGTRNIGNHNRFFAMLGIVLDNIQGEQFTTTTGEIIEINTMNDLLEHLKYQMGHIELFVTLGGKKMWRTKSISFAAMDEAEFKEFFNLAIDKIIQHFVPFDRDVLIEETNNKLLPADRFRETIVQFAG